MFKFQCGLWHSAHIDDVHPPPDKMPSFIEMYHNPVSTFLQEEKKMDVDEENETLKIDILSLINNCVQPALSKVKDPEEDSERTTERIRIILNLIQDSREKGNNHKARVNFIIPSPTKLQRDIVTLPSIRPSFHNILVNTLESTSFNGF